LRKDPEHVIELAAVEYGRHTTELAKGWRKASDLHCAMGHPDFKEAHDALLSRLAMGGKYWQPLVSRTPRLTVTLGAWNSKDEAVQAVMAAGHSFTQTAQEVIQNEKWRLLTEEVTFEFVDATVDELIQATGWSPSKRSGGAAYQSGYVSLIRTKEVFTEMQRLGFCVAPHESALAVRLAISDLMPGREALILSEPVPDKTGFEFVLGVENSSAGTSVCTSFSDGTEEWGYNDRLLLCRKVVPGSEIQRVAGFFNLVVNTKTSQLFEGSAEESAPVSEVT
jgi:hypothetical protein